MPSYGEMESMALSQVSRATSGGAGKPNLSSLIVANLKGAGKL
jgi:hypothetical protein